MSCNPQPTCHYPHLAWPNSNSLILSAHVKEDSEIFVKRSFPLSLGVGEHLPLNVLLDPYLHLVFHPLMSCEDVGLVSERLMAFRESKPLRAGRIKGHLIF